jgi:hypothetical protein
MATEAQRIAKNSPHVKMRAPAETAAPWRSHLDSQTHPFKLRGKAMIRVLAIVVCAGTAGAMLGSVLTQHVVSTPRAVVASTVATPPPRRLSQVAVSSHRNSSEAASKFSASPRKLLAVQRAHSATHSGISQHE